jgi:hypothetical protein
MKCLGSLFGDWVGFVDWSYCKWDSDYIGQMADFEYAKPLLSIESFNRWYPTSSPAIEGDGWGVGEEYHTLFYRRENATSALRCRHQLNVWTCEIILDHIYDCGN